MNPVKARIIQILTGQETCPTDFFLKFSAAAATEFIPMGVKADADALLIAEKAKGSFALVGLVGKSLLQGEDLSRFTKAYFGKNLDRHLQTVSDHLYEDTKQNGKAILVLREAGDKRFRSFVPIKNVDEVLAGESG